MSIYKTSNRFENVTQTMWRFRKLPVFFACIGILCLTLQIILMNRHETTNSSTERRQNLQDFFRESLQGADNESINEQPGSGFETLQGSWRTDALMFPAYNLTKRFLTLGIPTIKREKDTYLFRTLESLLNYTRKEQLEDIYIVIFLADFNEEWKTDVSQQLKDLYLDLINKGTMQIIKAPPSFYPSLTNLQHTYNDPEQKRKWRSKQNVDYAFLFRYSEELSTYYMQLEDDIYTVPGYISTIKKHITQKTEGWVCLEFSELGFIGKLYHSRDLNKLATMTLLFYEEQPVDFTFLYFNVMMLQFHRHVVRPTLFQHRGIQSSLPGKVQPLRDKYFDFVKKVYKGNNPPAQIFSTLKQGPDFPLYMAYALDDGYFWSQSAPQKGDTITLVFQQPQYLDKVIVDTGSKEHPTDKLESGTLEASLTMVNMSESSAYCTNDILLAKFQEGKAAAHNIAPRMGPFKAQCLRITFTTNQRFWVIIREIAVFVNDSPVNLMPMGSP